VEQVVSFFFIQIRWRHEINLFSNIRVLTFGFSGGIATPSFENDVEDVEETDVIVCEYSCLHQMEGALTKRKLMAHSVVVDLRHPMARIRSVEVSSCESSTKGRDFPPELLAPDWWDDLIRIMKPKTTRRLFIEHVDEDPLSLSRSGIGNKVILEGMAKRAACIIGPDVFRSSTHSVHRQVLTWARHQRRKDITDKSARVRKALSEAIAPMCFYVREPIVKPSDYKWKLRTCSMTPCQRKDYENCCREVRGALSSVLVGEWNSASDCLSPGLRVSSALLRLRHQCFHPDSHTLLHCFFSRNRHGDELSAEERVRPAEQTKGLRDSPAQPDLDIANLLLQKSSKMKELVSILTTDAGFKIDMEESSIRSPVDPAAYSQERTKKVAILAVLPEAQKLISLFLNSVGIPNEVMCRESLVGPISMEDSNELHEKQIGMAWAKQQRILSRFCGDVSDVDNNVPYGCNIVIAAPSHLVRWNNGLGIEGADVIVSMDDDWTGRGGYMVDTLLRRLLARSELVDKEVDLIRLVCADTIEANVFGIDVGTEESRNWPLDKEGYLALPSSEADALALLEDSMNVPASSFPTFPAIGLLRQRGMLLSEVLATAEPLPKLFGSGGAVKFLPKLNSNKLRNIGEEKKAELRFLQDLLHHELSASFGNHDETSQVVLWGGEKYSAWKKMLPHWSAADSNNFPIGLMTRQDLQAIGTQIYLERLSFSEGLGLHPDTKAPPIHLSQLRDSTWDYTQRGEVSSKLVMDDNPSTFLFYLPSRGESGLSMPSCSSDVTKSTGARKHDSRRFNAYAKLFSGSHIGMYAPDGSQGCEPLVFFPPLFPLLLESSKQAKLHSQASSVDHGPSWPSEVPQNGENGSLSLDIESTTTPKRKETEPALEGSWSEIPNSKRIKTLHIASKVGVGAAPADSGERGNSADVSGSPNKKSSPSAANSNESSLTPLDVEALAIEHSASTSIIASSPL
jgi:hypothetical protein